MVNPTQLGYPNHLCNFFRSSDNYDYRVGKIKVSNDTNKLGPKDFLTGCLVMVVAVFLVPILIVLFKISIYLAIAIGVIVAIVLGIALLGRVVRLIVFPGRRDDKDKNTKI